MLKRELKINLKSFLIWTGILLVMYVLVFAIYPSLMSEEQKASINELLAIFPKEILKAFNMDLSGIDTAFGWFKSEGYIFLVLVCCCYCALLASQILLKEESEKTIEFLYSKPKNRLQICASRVFCGYIYMISLIVIVSLFSGIVLGLVEEFDLKQFVLMSLSPLLVGSFLFSFILFISTIFKKTKKTTGLSLGIVFGFYFISIIALLSEKLDFLKYFTPYTLSDGRQIIETSNIPLAKVFIALIFSLIFIFLTFLNYQKKDLV